MRKVLPILILLIAGFNLKSQCVYKFTNGGGNNEWSNISNWALVSGTCAVSAVPGLNDDVIIDVNTIASSGVGVAVPNRINVTTATSGAKSISLIGSATGKGLYFQVSSKLTIAGNMDLSGIGANHFEFEGLYYSTLSFIGTSNILKTNNNHFKVYYINFELGSNYQLQDSLVCTETPLQSGGYLGISSNFNANGNAIVSRSFYSDLRSYSTPVIVNLNNSKITSLVIGLYSSATTTILTNNNTGLLATDSAMQYMYNYPSPSIQIIDASSTVVHTFKYIRFKAFQNNRLDIYDRGNLVCASSQIITSYFSSNMSLYCQLYNFTTNTFEVNQDATIGFYSNIPYYTPIINIGTLKKDAGCNNLVYFEAYSYNPGDGTYYHTNHIDINLTSPSTVDYCAFRGVRVTGASLTATNSFDLKLNSGITFASSPAPRTLAWTGAGGTANRLWNNPSNWIDLTSGFSCVPNYNDSVVFADVYMTGNRNVEISQLSMCGAIKIDCNSSTLNIHGGFFSVLLVGRGIYVDPTNKNFVWNYGNLHFVSEKRGIPIDLQNMNVGSASYFYGHAKWNFVSNGKMQIVTANQGYVDLKNYVHEFVRLNVLGPHEIGAADSVYVNFNSSHLKITYGYATDLTVRNNAVISNTKLIKGSSLIEFTKPNSGIWLEGITKDALGNPNFDLWNVYFSKTTGQSTMYFFNNYFTKDPVSFNKIKFASELFATTIGNPSTLASGTNPDKNYLITDSLWIENGGKLILQDGGSLTATNNNSVRINKAIYVDAACTSPYGKILTTTGNMANINGPGTLTSNKIIFTNISANSGTGTTLTSSNSLLNNSPNWTTVSPPTQLFYWNGEGTTTNWSDYRNWNVSVPPHVGVSDDASASYNVGHCIPSLFDSVIFTTHAFPVVGTRSVTIDKATDVKSIYWDATGLNLLYTPNSLIWNDLPAASLNIYSTLQMSNHALITYTAPTTFFADDNNNDLRFSSRQFPGKFTFNGNGTWLFKDSLYLGAPGCGVLAIEGWFSNSGFLEIIKGKINTQHHNINVNAIYSSFANTRTIDIRQSKVTLRAALYHYLVGPAYVHNLELLSDNLTLKADSSEIKILNGCTGRTAVSIRGAAPLNFNILDFYGTGSGGNEFYSNNSSSFKRVQMNGNSIVFGASTFDTLKLVPMTTNTFESGKIQLIDSLYAISNNCVQMILQSSTVGTKAILCDKKAALGEHLIVGFADLKDIKSDACGGPSSLYFPYGNASTSLGWNLNTSILAYGFLQDSIKLTCRQGPALLSSANFYANSTSSYQWTSSALTGTISTAPNYTATQSGWYTLNVGYTPICFYKDSVYVKFNNNILGTSSVTPVSCNSYSNGIASFSLTADTSSSHTYQFVWNTPAPSSSTLTLAALTNSYSSLTAGIYTITVTDVTASTVNCKYTQTISVTQPTPLLTGASTNSIACFGVATGSLNSSPTGGNPSYTYSWTNGSSTYTTQNVSSVSSGIYSITVTDTKSCTTTNTVQVLQPATAITSTLSGISNVLCFGASTGSATILGSGGTGTPTYSWNPGSMTTSLVTGLSANNYTVFVKDVNGCTDTKTLSITQPTSGLSISSLTTNSVLCYGTSTGSVNLTAIGGTPSYTTSWSGPSSYTATTTGLTNSIPASAGTYSATITDANGCTTSTTALVTGPIASVSVALTGSVSPTNCTANTGIANVSPSGGTGSGYVYTWINSAGTNTTAIATNTALPLGTTTVTIVDGNSCASNSITLNVTSLGAPTVAITTNSILCNGGTGSAIANVTGTAPYSYTWQASTSTTNNSGSLTAGTYTVLVNETSTGCKTIQTYTLSEPTALATAISNIVNVNCFGANNGSASVTATGGTPTYNYSWLPIGGSASTGTNLAQGVYTVTITDNNNCAKTNTVQILGISQDMTIAITDTVKPDCGNIPNGLITVGVTGGTPSYTYLWSNGTTTPSNINISNATYTVTVTDANNCSKQLEITLDCFTALFIPELYSPNGDGKNDKFEIKGIYNYPNNKIMIFNRWGSLVYQKEKYNNEWDGKPNVNTGTGKELLPSGTYYVVFDFGDNGKTKTYNGFVQLEY